MDDSDKFIYVVVILIVFFVIGLLICTYNSLPTQSCCSTCRQPVKSCVCSKPRQPENCCSSCNKPVTTCTCNKPQKANNNCCSTCSKPLDTCICNAPQKPETGCCSTPEPVKPSCECSNTPVLPQPTFEHTESNTKKVTESQPIQAEKSVTETVSEPVIETHSDYVDSGMSVVIDGVEYYLYRPAA